jgi:hypothetical protein
MDSSILFYRPKHLPLIAISCRCGVWTIVFSIDQEEQFEGTLCLSHCAIVVRVGDEDHECNVNNTRFGRLSTMLSFTFAVFE